MPPQSNTSRGGSEAIWQLRETISSRHPVGSHAGETCGEGPGCCLAIWVPSRAACFHFGVVVWKMEQYTRKVRRSPPRLVDNLELMTVRAPGLAGRARASRRAQDAGAFCLIHDFVVVRGGEWRRRADRRLRVVIVLIPHTCPREASQLLLLRRRRFISINDC